MIWDPIERLLWGVAITLLFLFGILLIKKRLSVDDKTERSLLTGNVGICIGYGLNSVFIYISDFLVPGSFNNFTYQGNYDLIDSTFMLLVKIAWIFLNLGRLVYLFEYERNILNTKYVITISLALFTVLVVILPFETGKGMISIMYIVYSLVLLFINLRLAQKSKDEYRTIQFFVLIGIVLMGSGMIFSSMEMKHLNVLPLFISPMLFLFGCIIFALPSMVDFGQLKKCIKLASFLYFFLILIRIFFLISIVLKGTLTYLVLPNTIGLIFIIYISIHSRIIMKTSHTKQNEENISSMFNIYTRPKRFTEDEVYVSKEKNICLVCKNKLIRYNIYICPECATFYCENCAQTFSNLENACWVCETPFDESKPVRLPKKAEDEITIEDINLKRNKKI